MNRLDRLDLSIYNSSPSENSTFAEVMELVDMTVSKTVALRACRFDSGLRHHKKQGAALQCAAPCFLLRFNPD